MVDLALNSSTPMDANFIIIALFAPGVLRAPSSMSSANLEAISQLCNALPADQIRRRNKSEPDLGRVRLRPG
jgi:hypothetical protein